MRLSIIIPVFNEADTLEEILARVMTVDVGMERQVVIVDDGSSDGTRELYPKIKEHRAVVTLEDNSLAGGFGSTVLELMADSEISCPVRRMGLPDTFVKQGPIDRLREEVGLVAEAVAAEATAMLPKSSVVRK